MKRSKATPRFLFIHPENENLGIEYLAASLKQNHIEVDLIFFPEPYNRLANFRVYSQRYSNVRNLIVKKIKSYQPQIVCFSPFTSQYLWAVEQARYIKKLFPKIFILFGGVHVNSVPEVVIRHKNVDAIIVGEADYQIVEFAKNFYRKNLAKIPSLWIKRKGKLYQNKLAKLETNLDRLPYPDKEIFYSQIPAPLRQDYMIMGSRGCPFHCTFCANNSYQKLYLGQKRLRFRSPENIIAELKFAKTKYHPRIVEFFDDVLTVDEARLERLMKLYRQNINLPFTCYIHPQLASARIINLLAKSKCCWLKVGVQSADEQYRRHYLYRHETNEQIQRLAKYCHQYHLTFSLDHILNLPGETESQLVEAVKFYNSCRPNLISSGTLIYLPNTDIVHFGLKHKIITPKDVININLGKNPVKRLANKKINYSVFQLLFMVVTVCPPFVTNLLLRLKIYRIKFPVPKIILFIFKILVKIRAGQLYIYRHVLNTFVYYGFWDLLKKFRWPRVK